MSTYETGLPLDSVKTVAMMVKDKTALENKAEFAFHLWNTQGYLQGLTLGNPNAKFGSPGTEAEGRGALEELSCLQEYGSIVAYADYDRSRINPIQIISMVSFIINMLKSLNIIKEGEEGTSTMEPPVVTEGVKTEEVEEKPKKKSKK